jgi:hypothetical protein
MPLKGRPVRAVSELTHIGRVLPFKRFWSVPTASWHLPNREFLAPMGGNKVASQAAVMMKKMEKAKFMAEQFRAIQAIVGMTGMRILTLCLIGKLDGKGPCTFSEVAESLGMGVGNYAANEDGALAKRLKNEGIKVGWAFRNSLDLLASHWEYGSAPALPKYGWR